MICPNCQHDTRLQVIDSRYNHDHIRRRRKCTLCNFRFSTIEVINILDKNGKLLNIDSDIESLIQDLNKLQNKLRKIRQYAGNL